MVWSEEEKELVKKIEDGSLEEVEALLNSKNVKINSLDENGMSFLQTAAYRGKAEICSLLIQRGADVNCNHQTHGYSPLMFAAIGGHARTVSVLLEAGADVFHRNSVGRNASQMAAFVGQHQVVGLMNNYIAKEELDYFTKIHGLEKEPKLSRKLVKPLHAYLRQTNINPVRLSLNLSKHPELVQNARQVASVLCLLCEREIKKPDANEMIALKCHHFCKLFEFIQSALEKDEVNVSDGKLESDYQKTIETVIKRWIKGRDSDGFPVGLETYLRQSIREFPYRDTGLFIQLVRTLASVEIGNEPSALTILSQAVSGQKGFDEDAPVCNTCGEPKPSKKCSQCKTAQYCNQECQRLHWFTHKKLCPVLKEKMLKAKEEEEKMLQEKQQEEEEHRQPEQSEDSKLQETKENIPVQNTPLSA